MKGKQLYDMKSMCNELCSMCHNTKNRVIEKMCECEKDKCVLLGKYMKCLLTMEQLCQYICTCCCEEEAISSNTMAEMKFDIGNITVDEGSWVRVTLINEGVDIAMQHNIVFINYGTRKEIASQAITAGSNMKYVPKNENVIAASDLAMPGETVVLEFEAPSKGNYEYLCTYPGHGEIMRGYFFVK